MSTSEPLETRARPAVFLDRDGVLNEVQVLEGVPHPPQSAADLRLLPGVAEALRAMGEAGFALVVVTNQPDVARGRQTRAAVDEINARLLSLLPVDGVLTCFHDTPDGCDCRKPKPGLLHEAARRWNLDLSRSFLVGDRWSDIEAGRSAGCRTFLIPRPYSERERCVPDHEVQDLLDVSRRISSTQRASRLSPIPSVSRLRVKIFADGADRAGMLEMAKKPFIAGFTTNPTLMRKAGVSNYRAFAKDVLSAIRDRPVSFEVFTDDFGVMERHAREIASWGVNVYVKIPVTNTRGEPSYDLIRRLARAGVKQNVTALMTLSQVRDVAAALADGPPACVSVFAGRIADTGRDPVPLMAAAVELLRPYPHEELIWASPRELLNIFQADAIGCHIITVTNDVLKKLGGVGKDLTAFSLETVQMFYEDGRAAGYAL